MESQVLEVDLAAYARCFGGSAPRVAVCAPGRVNLIGEHVDYNAGLVLPMAIDRSIRGLAGPANGGDLRVFSAATQELVRFELSDITAARADGWGAYVLGVAVELLDRDIPLIGTDMYLTADLPAGAGLASSAALEIAVALALLGVAGTDLEAAELAQLCRRAEHRFAGVPCGIMDQLACTMSRTGNALLIDCRDLRVTHVLWPDRDVAAVVIDSKIRRRLRDSAYAQRSSDCKRAVEHFGKAAPRIRSLRDVTREQLDSEESAMDPRVWRRARHVITEIERTAHAAEALRSGDFDTLGKLLDASHDSLRDDFEVSLPQLDQLAGIVRDVPGVFGCRLTGAGFGGCLVAIAPSGVVPAIAEAIDRHYNSDYAAAVRPLPVSAADAAQCRTL